LLQVLEALLKAQKDKKLSGIHGRLGLPASYRLLLTIVGDLGAIDDKDDCAITTACPRLSDIVVQTITQAQVIDIFKKLD
jgi:structural maintenance of chromosome 4